MDQRTTTGADEFEQHRSALFGLAYRMLGTVVEAENIVQETYLRWHQSDQTQVQSPRAYLITIATRLCVDQLRLAYQQREAYVGVWLPEPLFQSSAPNPADLVETNASISVAFLVLMESLSPIERAIFLLHQVFDYPFTEIAGIVGRSAADCRQIGHRARQKLALRRPQFRVEAAEIDQVVQQFLQVCLEGNVADLLQLLAEDVTVNIDSGGKVSAVRNMITGRDAAAQLLIGVFRRWLREPMVQVVTINGQAALLTQRENRLISVTSFDIQDHKIRAIYEILNPDKLQGFTAS